MILNYICTWHKSKVKTWSGTTYALYQACMSLFDVVDCGIRFSNGEKRISNMWGIATQSNQFNAVRDFFIWLRISCKRCGNPGIQLQIGDLLIPRNTCYIYQDLNVAFIKYLKQNDPVAYQYCGYAEISEKTLDKRIKRLQQVYEKSAGIFTMSRWLADFIVNDLHISGNKVHHVGGGINVNPEAIDESNKKSNKILFIGRDFNRKAGPLVVDAFKILVEKYRSDAELYIVGPVENPVKDNHPQIIFIGEVPSNKLSYYYNQCDVFCMPSYFDAYGLVFIEALSYGLPCIGRNKFAMKEFIQDGKNGYLVENDDAESLALKMFDLLKNDQIKHNVNSNRDRYINDYAWSSVAERIYQSIKTETSVYE